MPTIFYLFPYLSDGMSMAFDFFDDLVPFSVGRTLAMPWGICYNEKNEKRGVLPWKM